MPFVFLLFFSCLHINCTQSSKFAAYVLEHKINHCIKSSLRESIRRNSDGFIHQVEQNLPRGSAKRNIFYFFLKKPFSIMLLKKCQYITRKIPSLFDIKIKDNSFSLSPFFLYSLLFFFFSLSFISSSYYWHKGS